MAYPSFGEIRNILDKISKTKHKKDVLKELDDLIDRLREPYIKMANRGPLTEKEMGQLYKILNKPSNMKLVEKYFTKGEKE